MTGEIFTLFFAGLALRIFFLGVFWCPAHAWNSGRLASLGVWLIQLLMVATKFLLDYAESLLGLIVADVVGILLLLAQQWPKYGMFGCLFWMLDVE